MFDVFGIFWYALVFFGMLYIFGSFCMLDMCFVLLLHCQCDLICCGMFDIFNFLRLLILLVCVVFLVLLIRFVLLVCFVCWHVWYFSVCFRILWIFAVFVYV